MDLPTEDRMREFARELILTGEQDPIYTLVARTARHPDYGLGWTARFCTYFLMFYDAGGAAIAASKDNDEFWDRIRYRFDVLPRGKERRHFRGASGLASFTSLRRLGGPVAAFRFPTLGEGLGSFERALRGAGVVGFGPYLTLKWADLADAVYQVNFDYSDLTSMLPDPPKKALQLMFPQQALRDGLYRVKSWIEDLDEPFGGYRKCGLSEAETIACAVPTYLIKGRYKMGDDIAKYHKALADHPDLVALLPPKL